MAKKSSTNQSRNNMSSHNNNINISEYEEDPDHVDHFSIPLSVFYGQEREGEKENEEEVEEQGPLSGEEFNKWRNLKAHWFDRHDEDGEPQPYPEDQYVRYLDIEPWMLGSLHLLHRFSNLVGVKLDDFNQSDVDNVFNELSQLNLTQIKFESCSFTQVPETIDRFNLQYLVFEECTALISVPDLSTFHELQGLSIVNCSFRTFDLSTLKGVRTTCSIILREAPHGFVQDIVSDWWRIFCSVTIDDDYNLYFPRSSIDSYFEWLSKRVVGVMKYQILLNQALNRSVIRIFTPGLPKSEELKRSWEEMNKEEK